MTVFFHEPIRWTLIPPSICFTALMASFVFLPFFRHSEPLIGIIYRAFCSGEWGGNAKGILTSALRRCIFSLCALSWGYILGNLIPLSLFSSADWISHGMVAKPKLETKPPNKNEDFLFYCHVSIMSMGFIRTSSHKHILNFDHIHSFFSSPSLHHNPPLFFKPPFHLLALLCTSMWIFIPPAP